MRLKTKPSLTTTVSSKLPQGVKAAAVARREGYRSGLEVATAKQLDETDTPATYESHTIRFEQPAKKKRYTPDFVLWNGIVIETKGQFKTADRQKHVFVQDQYPDIDIRFVFSNPNQRIRKGSPTTYAMWCDKNGFKYAKRLIPAAWLAESPNVKSLKTIEQFRKEKSVNK